MYTFGQYEYEARLEEVWSETSLVWIVARVVEQRNLHSWLLVMIVETLCNKVQM